MPLRPSKTTEGSWPTGKYFPGDEEFLQGADEMQLGRGEPLANAALYLIALAVMVAVGWASLARVDEITRADGKVVADGREQVIASLEGGILRELMVQEGVLVDQGQELVRLDPTRVAAQQNEGQAKFLALRAAMARLEAEATGAPLKFPEGVAIEADVRQGELDSYQARRQALEEAVGLTRRNLGLVQRELAMAERMSSRGLMSDVEVMRLRRQSNEMELQVQERVNRFRQEARSEMVKVSTELSMLEEQMVVKRDVLKRTTLVSPVRGVVRNIKINTVGGVVPAGGAIMEILPIGSRVLVEARIKPSEVGFVRVGLPAEVKLSAYDFYTYGGLKGTIEYLSPDALTDETKAASPDNTYYRARIRTEEAHLNRKGQALPVMPGMTASVDIRTGERSVLQFLLKPVMKSQEAFRER